MIRGLLLIVVLAVVGFLAFGYWTGGSFSVTPARTPSITVNDPAPIDTGKARERGAELGEKAAVAADKARERGAELGEKAAVAATKFKEGVGEAQTTGKIKAKMALDDTLKSSGIDVTTEGSVVTLKGRVGSSAERTRAVTLARETAGVTRVIDQLEVQAR
jgi:osmotically-inducible protein OsmY